MDPQQRLLLEVAYESFENAGVDSESLWGSNTGVFVGQWASDYHEMMARDIEDPPLYLVTGTGPAITSNRISYCFNLRGPSFTVDTGCSSSFVALHQAIQSLRSGETSQCFVGGVNLLLDPQRFHYQSRLKMFSAEGRSFAFDSRANGYGRGEGCTGIVIKPLSAALRDGDNVRAVIRSSVLNQDGRTQGLTLPSAPAQREAILKAYQQAHLEPSADYVEAHGTGTKVGDPIEVSAIASVLAQGRAPRRKLPIGSVKANIGHTESAAGLAALIKAVLMLEKGIIPPQANYVEGNPEILLNQWNLRVSRMLHVPRHYTHSTDLSSQIPLRAERQNLRRISVNRQVSNVALLPVAQELTFLRSFGYGGTNAHVVVDAAADYLPPSTTPALRRMSWGATARVPRIFMVSAASQKSCQLMCKRLAKYLVAKQQALEDPERLLSRLSFTLGRHTVFPHRVAHVACDVDDLVSQLLTTAHGAIPHREKLKNSRIAFIFSGQGAQYAEMGRQLLHTRPVFFQVLERARAHLCRLGCSWDLVSELCRPKTESHINEPAYAQPLSTAVQIALVDLLAELGVVPTVVVGHSSGEIAAAYAAGHLSFEDAMAAAYFRGKLTGELVAGVHQGSGSNQGAMLAVGASPAVVEKHISSIDEEHGRVRIACFNSPNSVTISGDAPAIGALAAVLEGEGVFNRKLMTNGAAYHSHQMEPLADEYENRLSILKPRPAGLSAVRMVSSVTGQELGGEDVLDGSYWVRNLLSPVFFSQALGAVVSEQQQQQQHEPIDMIIEVGPHSQLAGPVKQCLKARPKSLGEVAYTHTLKRNSDAEESLLRCLGDIICFQGSRLRIEYLSAPRHQSSSETPALLGDLPAYPFDHSRTFWHESRLSRDYRNRPHIPHELLGVLSADVNPVEPRWRRFLSLKETPWLRKHVVQGQVVFPAAGYLTMAAQAARQHALASSPAACVAAVAFRNVHIGKALVLSDKDEAGRVEITLSLRPQARSARESSAVWNEFRVFSVTTTGAWTEHCRGLVRAEQETEEQAGQGDQEWTTAQERFAQLAGQCRHEVSTSRFYALAREIGLDWQDPFDNLDAMQAGAGSCLATAKIPTNLPEPGGLGDILHPAVLDSVLFHGLCYLLMKERGAGSAIVPTFIEELRLNTIQQHVQAGNELAAASTGSHDGGPTYDVFVSNGGAGKGDMVLQAQGIHYATLPGDVSSTSPSASRELCHDTEWVTYSEAWTSEHRDSLCKSTVSEGSVAAQNRVLEALTLHYVQQVLSQVSIGDIPSGSYFRRLFEWMQTLSTQGYETSLVEAYQDGGSAGVDDEAISRLGPRLGDILTHKVDPLALLTPDNLLARLYADDRCLRCYSQMAAWCKELGRQKSGLRVLEIGAGTASTTVHILGALEGCVGRYDFTDLSSGFFESARARLGELAKSVDFKPLNIENDPQEQGFEGGDYDLIIASNVLHATKRIDDTLSNVRSLLRPGGRLMLLEVTSYQVFYNIIFGVFEGWWAGYDEGRRQSPLLEPAEWVTRLQEAGFSEVERCFEDYPATEGGTLSVFVASAPQPARAAAGPSPEIYFLSTNEGQEAAVDASEKVQALLGQTKVSVQHLAASPREGGIAVILPEIGKLLSDHIDPLSFEGFKAWILSSSIVLLVSEESDADEADAGIAGFWTGFARCLRLEHPEIRIITLQLQKTGASSVHERLVQVLPHLSRSPTFDLDCDEVENEFAERDGQLFVPRLVPRRELTDHVYRSGHSAEPEMTQFLDSDRTLTAELGIPGLLESFRWKDDLEAPQLGPDDIRIELRAASINFKDVLIAAGQLEGITEMRNDCSGVVVNVGENMRARFKAGDRVCALYSRSYTNYPVVHGDCCQIIPDSMSFEEGASLPIVWGTVYHSLIDLGRLQRGDKILIHSAAGAVGQAAIMLAQHVGAEVFATVSNSAKRELLERTYGIPSDHIFSSRTTAFRAAIARLTKGYGVDVVLNSLGGEIFRESCNLVAHFGRFVEIGRKDLMDDALMPMGFLLKNVTFAYVDLAGVIERNKPLARRILDSLGVLAAAGCLRAVPLTVMPISEIETAFRLIQAGKHTGKVILTVEPGQKVKVCRRK